MKPLAIGKVFTTTDFDPWKKKNKKLKKLLLVVSVDDGFSVKLEVGPVFGWDWGECQCSTALYLDLCTLTPPRPL